MPDPDSAADLERRVAKLEELVARLVAESEGRPETRARGDYSFSWAQPREGAAGSASGARSGLGAPDADLGADIAEGGERWLGRVGVAFVVLAFGFLFKYAFDQGWIGPAFRLILGGVAATVMLVIGLRLEGARERYSQYLLGGAVAVYYLVGFASYQLYALVPFAVAFAFMAATTVLAFVLAERQRFASLAVIGAAGGLATPFLVSSPGGSASELVAYTTLLLAGAGALWFWRGWKTLLFVLGLGGLAVMGVAVGRLGSPPGVLERTIVLGGILAAWALFGALPLVRARLHRVDPATWPDPGSDTERERWTWPFVMVGPLRPACLIGSLAAVFEIGALLKVDHAGLGVLFALACVVYALLAWRHFETRPALDAAAETASILLALGIVAYFLDARVFLPLAVLAAGMHSAHDRWSLPGVSRLAHFTFMLLLIVYLGRAAGQATVVGRSPFGVVELSVLAAIVLAAVTSLMVTGPRARAAYLLSAHVAFLLWLVAQLLPTALGQELISLSWGVYGIVLLLVAMKIDRRGLQMTGLATLGLVALKLVLVDMAQIDVIWRILLFMGFGAAFLGLSYLINRRVQAE